MNIIPSSRKTGFTLVEIMIVVVIIGILATLGLPAFRQVRANSQNARFYQDVRVFASAAEMFMLETGVDPFTNNAFGDPSSGTLSTEMQEYIKIASFSQTTPIGGNYDFDNQYQTGGGVDFFGVGTDGFTVGIEQIQMMDEQHDDNALGSGNLVQPSSDAGRYYYVIATY